MAMTSPVKNDLELRPIIKRLLPSGAFLRLALAVWGP